MGREMSDFSRVNKIVFFLAFFGFQRFNHDWKKMEDELKAVDATRTQRALSRVKSRYGGAPGEDDLQGAARALNRLQSVYRLIVLS